MKNYKITKLACYSSYFTMSSVFCLPPLLFVTFHEVFGVSYTLLGTLVLANFSTQLIVDLVFTFFSRCFNIKAVLKTMPLITSLGLLLYALVPFFFPNRAYLGLLLGTVVFSVSAGLSEVLLSPVIAAIPSDNQGRDMSLLHSLYAFGVLTVVLLSTLFLKLFGTQNWMYLVLFWAAVPIISSVLFYLSAMPDMSESNTLEEKKDNRKKFAGLAVCALCIFFGGSAENAMSNWVSGYLENSLGLDKLLGDVLGVAGFAVFLGAGRMMYAKYGKEIIKTLLFGMTGALLMYLMVSFSPSATLSLIACALTGLFTSMLWPGVLIMMEERVHGVGVGAFALMAASGDLGASVAPQLMGIVVDKVSQSSVAAQLAPVLLLSCEQIGMRAGMLVSSFFALFGVISVILALRVFKRKNAGANE